MNDRRLRESRCFLSPILAIMLGLASFACGGGGSGGSSSELIINGTWVSSSSPPVRGRFVMTGSTSVSGLNGTLSGTIQFFDQNGSQVTSEPVSGTLSEDIGSNSHWDIEFATADGKLTFFTASYDGHTSASQMVGSFINTKGTSSVTGSWHSNPAGGPTDCVIDKVFYQTGFTFQDLAWDGSKLVAVATPTGGSAGVYELDTSGSTLVATPKTLSPTPVGQSGIAWDGTRYRVLGVNGPHFTLDTYESSWTSAGGTVTGNGYLGYVPDWIAYWSGYLWYAPLLGTGAYRIDPATAAITLVSGIQLDRPMGADSDGTTIWSAYFPPGGVWPAFHGHGQQSGTLVRSIYGPENKGSDGSAVTCEGTSFLWASVGQNLYRLDLR